MPRYEFSEGTSNKFWDIRLDDNRFTTTWGKIGTAGQSKTQTFTDAAEARREYEKIVVSKVKKGYRLAEGSVEPAPVGAAAGESASNPELEAKILADPETEAHWQVYGDWLQAQGDVRGQLMALQARGEDDEAQVLIAQRAAELFGPLAERAFDEDGGLLDDADAELVDLEWKWGFLWGLKLKTDYDRGSDLAELLTKLLERPVARFLRKLTVGLTSFEGDASAQEVIDALVASKKTELLEELFLTDFEYPDESEMSWVAVGDLSKLWKAAPRLQRLKLRGGMGCTLGKVDAPSLVSFTHETGGMSSAELTEIAHAHWPNLRRLEIWTGQDEYAERSGRGVHAAGVDQLDRILAAEGLPNLRHLGVRNCEFVDDVVARLPKSKLLKQLESLDLSMGTLHGPGAEVLERDAKAFAHLRRIDLGDNMLTDDDVTRLKGLPNVEGLDNQREADEYDDEVHRYAAVGE